ncbi:hypothetical protein [Bradyrhizobium guangzhouense]|uniref:hypothetical protein n=1 Tax=Bradyrhizobium guangzhouense TaxID=1325095 RepID=UPI0013E8E963|nr:hypothetical protein [Bradyrhizobium guangzhouense]
MSMTPAMNAVASFTDCVTGQNIEAQVTVMRFVHPKVVGNSYWNISGTLSIGS